MLTSRELDQYRKRIYEKYPNYHSRTESRLESVNLDDWATNFASESESPKSESREESPIREKGREDLVKVFNAEDAKYNLNTAKNNLEVNNDEGKMV